MNKPWIPERDSAVWVIDRDGTLIKKWVERYNEHNDTLILRTVQSPKKRLTVFTDYPAKQIGNTIHRSYNEAKLCIKMRAYKFPEQEKQQ